MDERETIQEIKERLVKIETLLEGMSKTNNLEMDNLNEKIKVCNHRISDLESQNRWLWRTVVSGLIAGSIALLFR